MKRPAGYAPPRRLAQPRKQVRLHLRRSPAPEPEDGRELEQGSHFWRWVMAVALFHVLVFGLVAWFYASAAPRPVQEFMSLLPPGTVVKGTTGAQAAPKLGPSTAAPSVHHHSEPPKPTAHVQPKPAPPKPDIVPPPKPVPVLAVKPAPPPPPKPKPPKVKVDLNLVDGPTPPLEKPAKPKPHHKKPVVAPPDREDSPDSEAAAHPDNTGLSREEIAAKLGEKPDAKGVAKAETSGVSGSTDAKANPYAGFYDALRDQVMSQWASPNLTDDTAVDPVVQIHVEKDGRVPTDSVRLVQSSGNPSYDNSAVTAAKSLGYLHEPLPDGCPPDIPITFKLTR